MTGYRTRRVLVTIVAALVVVIGGAFAAAGQIGALGDHATSASPSDGPVTDDATDDATDDVTEDESTKTETDEATEAEADEADETDQDETDQADGTTEDEGSDGAGAAEPKAPCTLTSPPNRAAAGTDAERHPGWSTGRHLGWCVAAAHRHHTTGRPAKPGSVGGEKHADKPARPDVKAHKKPHQGLGHAKHH
jgi:hypothetical protein